MSPYSLAVLAGFYFILDSLSVALLPWGQVPEDRKFILHALDVMQVTVALLFTMVALVISLTH